MEAYQNFDTNKICIMEFLRIRNQIIIKFPSLFYILKYRV